eukprot:CAMPEP_0117544054 /NCGR_PEP_ID=MMETSP0784-20121206/45375_1 /TAXON_ID=39447 /ORGANISM="" /LENGTH=209 /DNA_ID=CAMNT_0005340845 /DNA_START=62 /DNA_END=688 /DNA_ORIENTATION=-
MRHAARIALQALLLVQAAATLRIEKPSRLDVIAVDVRNGVKNRLLPLRAPYPERRNAAKQHDHAADVPKETKCRRMALILQRLLADERATCANAVETGDGIEHSTPRRLQREAEVFPHCLMEPVEEARLALQTEKAADEEHNALAQPMDVDMENSISTNDNNAVKDIASAPPEPASVKNSSEGKAVRPVKLIAGHGKTRPTGVNPRQAP